MLGVQPRSVGGDELNIILNSIELSNGETIGYRERVGGDDVLLLIHGNMTSSKHWDLLMEALPQRFKLYAIDLRGFGTSSYHSQIERIKDFSDDVKLLADALGLQKFSICGWSTGGAVGMQFTIDYREYVDRLILLASASTRGYPFYSVHSDGSLIRLESKEEILKDQTKTIPVLNAYKNRDKQFLRQLWELLIYTTNLPDKSRYEEYLEDMMTQRNLVDVYQALNTFNISCYHNGLLEGTGQASRIDAPTLILWGENDLVVPYRMTNEIIEDLGEDVQSACLKNCGHSPLVDDIDQLIEKITNFII